MVKRKWISGTSQYRYANVCQCIPYGSTVRVARGVRDRSY